MYSYNLLSFTLIVVSTLIPLFSTIYIELNILFHWKVILTVHSSAIICGTIAMLILDTNNIHNIIYYIITAWCVIISIAMTHILNHRIEYELC